MLSLRLLSAIDWNAFFEQSSHVEAILREDPSGVYPRQDFATSDRYRRIVEMIARGSGADEIEVARRAIDLARQGSAARWRDVGERAARPRRLLPGRPRPGRPWRPPSAIGPGWRERLFEWVLGHPGTVYFGSIAVLLAAFLALAVGAGLGPGGSWWLLLAVVLLLLPLSELAVGLVNHVLTLLLPPRVLPKLDFKEGIPAEQRDVHRHPVDAGAGLERARCWPSGWRPTTCPTPTRSLRFALLTDFADAPEETMPQDDGHASATPWSASAA